MKFSTLQFLIPELYQLNRVAVVQFGVLVNYRLKKKLYYDEVSVGQIIPLLQIGILKFHINGSCYQVLLQHYSVISNK